jgi:type IX secretion system PorP/SprF family membrane protein
MKTLALIITLISFIAAEGQQLPIYTNYNFNLFGINPAAAGSQSCLDLRMGYRRQWLGFPGEPKSTFIGVNGSFGKKRFNFHGVGIKVETDESGPMGFTSLSGSYSYHIKVNKKNMLSLGSSLGFSQHRLDVGQVTAEDFSDPAITASQSQVLFPQIGMGIWYQSQDRYIGFSARNIIENKFTSFGTDSRFRRHSYLILGKSIPVNDNLFFKPSVNIRHVSRSPLAADVNLLFDLNDLFEFGMSFRGGHGVSGMVKVAVLKYLTVGYAYDRTINKLRVGGANSHEIMLGIQACPRGEKKGIKCSAYD